MGAGTDDIARRVLLMAAHPNDEFSLAATLAAHIERGDAVWYAWFAHDDRARVDRQRRAEAVEAMRILGVPSERQIFADLPPVALAAQLPELVRALDDVVSVVSPDLAYCPAYEGGHPDHDSLNFAAWESVVSAGIECREYPIYRRSHSRRLLKRLPRFARLLPGLVEPDVRWLSPEEIAFKRDLWRVYKTQHPVMDVLLRLSGDEYRFFAVEQSRVIPLRDYMKPPHERPLLYEDSSEPQYVFEEFARAVRHFHWSGGIEEEAI